MIGVRLFALFLLLLWCTKLCVELLMFFLGFVCDLCRKPECLSYSLTTFLVSLPLRVPPPAAPGHAY